MSGRCAWFFGTGCLPVLFAAVFAAGCGGGCGGGEPVRNMLPPEARQAARRQFRREGVTLTVREPVGLARRAEPVTSGVPLPEGAVRGATRLRLANADGRSVPCQFTVQARWPDGSVKWVLLDFQTDVSARGTVRYTLAETGGRDPAPEGAVVARETEQGVELDNGGIRIGFRRDRRGLFHALAKDGAALLAAERAADAVLTDGAGKVWRASAPVRLEVEHRGPLRTTVRVQGRFEDESGETIHDGKVGYDLRATLRAGRNELDLDFTLRNDGWYGYRNESRRRRRRPRQWLHIRSLRLDMPLATGSEADTTFAVGGKTFALGPDGAVEGIQWYQPPTFNALGEVGIVTRFGRVNLAPHARAAGMARHHKGFYVAWTENGSLTAEPGRASGEAMLALGNGRTLRLANRDFWQNWPRGFAAAREGENGPTALSFVMLPEGGRWPETLEAFQAGTYQFEGGRRKTASLRLSLDADDAEPARRLDTPLTAQAATAWYRDTGAVLPLPDESGAAESDPDPDAEARARYERMQRAKVVREAGDDAGAHRADHRRYGKVSIPHLQELYPDMFAGWMNYGDLIWDHGYCSLHYDWPYSMLIHHLRLGDREFLDVAEAMVRHRYDIDQYHVEDTAAHLGGFQRYEKGEHGHLRRQAEKYDRALANWEINAGPSHTWNRGLLLHWALTGDPRSLDAAEQNGRAYRRFFYGQHKLGEKEKLPWRQFRVPGWAIENWLALYEYTGKPEYLDWANEIFDKSLLAMEQENGGIGHILPDGRQDGQFTAYIVEPVCRLHHYTGRDEIIGFLQRVLDWQREAGTVGGKERDGLYRPIFWRAEWPTGPEPEQESRYERSQDFGWLFADGYAYLYRTLGRAKDRAFAGQVFRDNALYYGMAEVEGGERHALGYHWGGCPFGFTPKRQALNGRYGLLFLQVKP